MKFRNRGRSPRVKNVQGTQALARSMEILSRLVSSHRPMTATELAETMGLHQSTVSRILGTLQGTGFVRKPDYHSFAPDYGLLTFARGAIHHFDLIQASEPLFRKEAPVAVLFAFPWPRYGDRRSST